VVLQNMWPCMKFADFVCEVAQINVLFLEALLILLKAAGGWASTCHPQGVLLSPGKRGNKVQGTNLACYSRPANNRLDAWVQNGRRKECKR
jgi:hypothetical protein